MSFKEFVKWCNERACDGCWGPITAIYCINAINIIREKPFWKREKEWQKYNAEMKIVEKLVYPTNEKIKFIDEG